MAADLSEALEAAVSKVAFPPLQAGPLLQRHARRRRREHAAIALFTAVIVAGGVLVGSRLLPSGGTDSLTPAATPSATSAMTGRDWLIDAPTPRHSDGTIYDPEDEDDLPTASSSPRIQEDFKTASAALAAVVERASLPAGTRVKYHEGDFAFSTAEITLPTGQPVIIYRNRYDHPVEFRRYSGDGVGSNLTVEDVPGTTAAALIDPDFPYSFPTGHVKSSVGVVIVAADGVTTTWFTPKTFSLPTLLSYAFRGAGGT